MVLPSITMYLVHLKGIGQKRDNHKCSGIQQSVIMSHNDSDRPDELTDQLNNELTKAYLGGLLDGTGSITVKVHKDDDYSYGYNIEPEVSVNKTRPHSIQIIDDWTMANGIFGSANKYRDRYQFKIGRSREIRQFLETVRPYIQDRGQEVDFLLNEILPLLDESHHLESRENFIEVVELVDELKEMSIRAKGSSKYTADFFRDEWAEELESD